MSPGRVNNTLAENKLPLPPLDGSLHPIYGFADWQAEYNPSRPFVFFPKDGATGESQSLTFAEFAAATHRMAHAVRPKEKGKDGEVVAILVNCDSLHYQALIVGVSRAGWVPFPMSPRNAPEAVVNMIEKTSAHRIIAQPSLSGLTSAIKSQLAKKNYAVELDEVPSLFEVYPRFSPTCAGKDDFVPYPNKDTAAPELPVLYLHSSGSTGFPKPIPSTRIIATQWANAAVAECARRLSFKMAAFSVPTFHAFGYCIQICVPLCASQAVGVYGPRFPEPPVIPTMQNMLEAAQITECTALSIVPSFLESWAESEEIVQYLASLTLVGFGGGPLSKAVGDRLVAAGVKLTSVYGGTEFGGPCPMLDNSHGQLPEDWEYLCFTPKCKPRFVDQGDGSYELQVLTCKTHQPSIENLPDVRGYNTSDLFVPHPTKEGLWKIIGRTDDVITLSTAEKVVPIPQEGYLHTAPLIAGAVMFGRGRSQPGVLIEPKPEYAIDPKDSKAVAEFRNKVWPYVEEANKLGPAFARIFKELILVSDPKKPLPRASKSTIQKKMALKLYEEEVENLYDVVQASTDASGIDPPTSWSAEALEAWLSAHATAINEGQEPSSSVDLFQQGFDSLSATYLRNRILGALRASDDPAVREAAHKVPDDIIFANPTIQWLAGVLSSLVSGDNAYSAMSVPDQVEGLITKYSANMPKFAGKTAVKTNQGMVVMLTGSTGGLGSHLLANLLEMKEVTKVYTLDRASGVADRQKLAFSERKLPVKLLSSKKLVTLSANHNASDLGLSKDVLDEIKNTATHIVHNAWKLDFNLSVSSFESNIASTRAIIDICASCKYAVKFIFTSSIASAGAWDTFKGKVPEEILETINYGGITGYAASKYVTEWILSIASKQGLSSISLRIGQISGAQKTGSWNVTDWVPIIVKSSVKLGCIPTLDGDASFMLMDTVVHTVTDIMLTLRKQTPPEIVNVVHPHPVSWNKLFEGINEALTERLEMVPFQEWLSRVEVMSNGATATDMADIPAIKLLSFLRAFAQGDKLRNVPEGCRFMAGGMADYATTKAESLSPSLHKASPLTKKDAAMWVQYWRSKDMIV
ncbi:putative NRPS-like protein biosynthetic cluster [Steccherinum ochraceum]|uniref:Putative NRPS-like protein biosynthetic cluster n=1 Tax=Steccherinum ochraceum TaxID=92696 RepID=A0A4R0RE12_9APHY|nr:putative NRPS-like protein biosynthetic cluster [Steccherinum ochraceum]